MSIVTYPTDLSQIFKDMLNCEQTPGQSVWQHGLSVLEHCRELLNCIEAGNCNENWKLPSWLQVYKTDILSNIDLDTLFKYTQWHDCGKPYCRTVDENGKVHFPNHEDVSRDVYFGATGDREVADLIGDDMIFHTVKSEELTLIMSRPNGWDAKHACHLLIAALAEIHSNAKMFGGMGSVSFKAKFKQLDRRGKQVLKYYFGEK